MTPNEQEQQEVSSLLAELDSAEEAGKERALAESLAKEAGPAAAPWMQAQAAAAQWAVNLPRNISAGVLTAAINASEFVESGVEGVKSLAAGSEEEKISAPADASAPEGALTPAPALANDAMRAARPAPVIALSLAYDAMRAARPAIAQFRDHLTRNNDTKDDVTQAIAQYVVPFLGWSKVIGGLKGASMVGTVARAAAAETLTSATVLAPHEGRMADLLDLGRQAEGKFGAALRAAAPDGSLLNAYIDYMTNRENETEAEGRFKNVVDSLVSSAAFAGVFKAGAVAFRGAKLRLQALVEGAGTAQDVPPAALGAADIGLPPIGKSTVDDLQSVLEGNATDSQMVKVVEEGLATRDGSAVRLNEKGVKALNELLGTPLPEPKPLREATGVLSVKQTEKGFTVYADGAPVVTTKTRAEAEALIDKTKSAEAKGAEELTVEPNHSGAFEDSFRKEHFVPEGSTVVTAGDSTGKPVGLLAMKESETGSLQISNAVVKDEQRGTGKGKALLLRAAQYAEEQGKPLVSDSTVTVNQLRVYESLAKEGKISVEYADPEAVRKALEGGDGRRPVKGPGGQPVVKKITLQDGEKK